MDFKNKVAVITGGAQGIGRCLGVCKYLAVVEGDLQLGILAMEVVL